MISSPSFALRVVAIDDDVQHLKFISTVLSSDQVVVSTVADPHAGLDVVRKERPHLVLVDLMMPGATGIELLEKILQFDPSPEVVLLTGQYSTESAVEAIQKGAADYLTKPVDVEKLQQRVESLLSEVRKGQRCLELENELLDRELSVCGHGRAQPCDARSISPYPARCTAFSLSTILRLRSATSRVVIPSRNRRSFSCSPARKIDLVSAMLF